MNPDSLLFSPACERNKQPIFEQLERVLPESGTVLEVGSGTGQHVVYFAKRLPGLPWQPTEQAENLADLNLRLQQEGGANILPALELDVATEWPAGPYAAVFSANTAHIMSWQEVVAMFTGVAAVLQPGGIFCLYGPFNRNGQFTSESNAAFDQQLKVGAPHMGIREVEALESLADDHHMKLEEQVDMPANNQVLVFRRSG